MDGCKPQTREIFLWQASIKPIRDVANDVVGNHDDGDAHVSHSGSTPFAGADDVTVENADDETPKQGSNIGWRSIGIDGVGLVREKFAWWDEKRASIGVGGAEAPRDVIEGAIQHAAFDFQQ